MEFQMLKDFLISGKTQKDFAKEYQMSAQNMRYALFKQMRKLCTSDIIDANRFIENDQYKYYIWTVKRNKKCWLQAIESYESALSVNDSVKDDSRKLLDLTVSEFMNIVRDTFNWL
jgi:hypothetical protein